MNKQKIILLIKEGKTQREIAEIFSCSQTTIRYWMKKYSLRTENKVGRRPKYLNLDKRTCSICKEEKLLAEFYTRTRGGPSGYCKACASKNRNDYQKKRAFDLKKELIAKLGGKCKECGYNKNLGALSFHHINPAEKSFSLSSRELRVYKREKVLKELKKCVLLCNNCHAETHYPELNNWKSTTTTYR